MRKNFLILGMVAILSFILASKSQAEVISCINGKYANGTECEKCGDSCDWSFDTTSGKLNVFGSGSMYNYSGNLVNGRWITNNPWANLSIISSVKSVDIKGLENIGDNAFSGSNQSIRKLTIADSVTSIGKGAFYRANIKTTTLPESLTSLSVEAFEGSGLTSIVLPDSLNSIATRAFAYNSGLTSVVIPDSVTMTGNNLFGVFSQNYDTVKIICKGDEESCAYLENKVRALGYNMDNFGYADSDTCIGSYIYENGKCHKRNENQCNNTDNYYYNGASCVYRPSNGKITCFGNSHKENDGYCDRIRYTPAEAAAVLHDDNTNSVTITFKK